LTIDDFVLLKVIGTGSYGKVILSKKKDNEQVYAIKTLKKKHLIKKNQVEHTLAERSILVIYTIIIVFIGTYGSSFYY
jgi:serum/glucocorticoid-regulated kinase 2